MVSLKEFVGRYRIHDYVKGEVLVTQSEAPEAVYFIKAGLVKAYNLTTQGEEKPISYSQSGEILPLEWVFAKYDHAPYFYEALTDTVVYIIPRPDFLEFVRNRPDVLFDLCHKLVTRRITHQMHIHALQQSKASDKVLYVLDFLTQSYGESTKSGLTKVTIPFAQQDLANFMGLTRETTSIELKKLERQDVIYFERPHFLVDVVKLRHLLDQDAVSPNFDKPPESWVNTYTAYGKTYK